MYTVITDDYKVILFYGDGSGVAQTSVLESNITCRNMLHVIEAATSSEGRVYTWRSPTRKPKKGLSYMVVDLFVLNFFSWESFIEFLILCQSSTNLQANYNFWIPNFYFINW